MRFATPKTVRIAVMPLLGMALVPAVLALALAGASLNRAEEIVRLPAAAVARPPAVRASPVITVQLSRQGVLTVAGQVISAASRAAVWQREPQAVRLLGFEPAQATVRMHADADVPTEAVQQLIEEAGRAGFQRCTLLGSEEP